MLAALIAVTTFGTALLFFALAEGMLDNRKGQLVESHCRSDAPAPMAASALYGLAAGLALASTVALVFLLVLLFRYPSRRSAIAVPLTTVAVLASTLFMLGVGYETVRPASASAGSHSCGSG
ncbi:hypothetical protein ACFVAV_04340 [Nocardia sp. NPDC057663]|uniref:hypothetical protein n=1 Tax=Nocardia sp. NPDC057663 TaxID=3346201 RepID=UPI00366AA81E